MTASEPDDAELLRRVRHQLEPGADRSESVRIGRIALEELLRRHADWLGRLCLFEVRSPALAADCLQEVLLEIARSIPSFEGRSALRTWMFVIARRVCRRLRKRDHDRDYRFPLGTAEDVSVNAEPAVPQRDEIARLELSERQHLVLESVRALPEKQRLAVMCHYFEDLSVESTAARLGCSVGAVKTHLFRARERLRQELGPELDVAERARTV